MNNRILYVVGIGPGNEEGMTIRARRILDECSVIAGYKTYIDLVKSYLAEDKKYISTGMKQERDRCRQALDYLAANDEKLCMICSGDASVYGMAGILFEMAAEYENIDIEVVPGVSAAMSGSALLGAAIGHDIAIISLSDLLTPRELIEKRLISAAQGDFVICLYNPASRQRADYLRWACELIMQYKSEDTVCGYVKNIGRDEEQYNILTLKELMDTEVDMFTTVFIGNDNTKIINGRMVTPRGYIL